MCTKNKAEKKHLTVYDLVYFVKFDEKFSSNEINMAREESEADDKVVFTSIKRLTKEQILHRCLEDFLLCDIATRDTLYLIAFNRLNGSYLAQGWLNYEVLMPSPVVELEYSILIEDYDNAKGGN